MAEFLDNWRDRWYGVLDWYDDVGRGRKVAVVVVVALLVGVGFWQLRSDSESAESGSVPGESAEIAEPTPTTDAGASVATTDNDPVATTDNDPVATTDNSAPVPPTSLSAEESAVSTVAGGTPLDYPTSPDGAPLPVVVVFDTETITISGQVPSEQAKDRLAVLATANSQFPDAEVIDNMVVNPAVPISVGVRVIELNSARFPEGSADILPDHARELDRVVNIMNALPNISVLVVGHADQRGDDLSNFAISDERARAVVNYLLYLGISPTRLASRAAGEIDLLTLGDDEGSLALNRRTEFIFGGLLIE